MRLSLLIWGIEIRLLQVVYGARLRRDPVVEKSNSRPAMWTHFLWANDYRDDRGDHNNEGTSYLQFDTKKHALARPQTEKDTINLAVKTAVQEASKTTAKINSKSKDSEDKTSSSNQEKSNQGQQKQHVPKTLTKDGRATSLFSVNNSNGGGGWLDFGGPPDPPTQGSENGNPNDKKGNNTTGPGSPEGPEVLGQNGQNAKGQNAKGSCCGDVDPNPHHGPNQRAVVGPASLMGSSNVPGQSAGGGQDDIPGEIIPASESQPLLLGDVPTKPDPDNSSVAGGPVSLVGADPANAAVGPVSLGAGGGKKQQQEQLPSNSSSTPRNNADPTPEIDANKFLKEQSERVLFMARSVCVLQSWSYLAVLAAIIGWCIGIFVWAYSAVEVEIEENTGNVPEPHVQPAGRISGVASPPAVHAAAAAGFVQAGGGNRNPPPGGPSPSAGGGNVPSMAPEWQNMKHDMDKMAANLKAEAGQAGAAASFVNTTHQANTRGPVVIATADNDIVATADNDTSVSTLSGGTTSSRFTKSAWNLASTLLEKLSVEEFVGRTTVLQQGKPQTLVTKVISRIATPSPPCCTFIIGCHWRWICGFVTVVSLMAILVFYLLFRTDLSRLNSTFPPTSFAQYHSFVARTYLVDPMMTLSMICFTCSTLMSLGIKVYGECTADKSTLNERHFAKINPGFEQCFPLLCASFGACSLVYIANSFRMVYRLAIHYMSPNLENRKAWARYFEPGRMQVGNSWSAANKDAYQKNLQQMQNMQPQTILTNPDGMADVTASNGFSLVANLMASFSSNTSLGNEVMNP